MAKRKLMISDVYERMDFPEYVFQEFPKALHRYTPEKAATKDAPAQAEAIETRVVHSKEDEAKALAAGFVPQPHARHLDLVRDASGKSMIA